MSLKSKIKNNKKIAVFTRNHRKYLEAATSRNEVRPERFTTFRSALRWVNAHLANTKHGAITIYFAPVGGDKGVEYEAILHQIYLDPVAGNTETQEVLAPELESTREEGLWEQYEKPVKTLYVISHCHRLEKPFPISALIKVTDDKTISENYGYSYSLVYERHTFSEAELEIYPDEITKPEKYKEGTTRTISVNVYERSSAARKACIEHYGWNCSVCGFNFQDHYGVIGKEFIHVHHLISLAKVDDRYEVDPITDLRPVCPNCHAMIHSETPPISLENLRSILNTSKRE